MNRYHVTRPIKTANLNQLWYVRKAKGKRTNISIDSHRFPLEMKWKMSENFFDLFKFQLRNEKNFSRPSLAPFLFFSDNFFLFAVHSSTEHRENIEYRASLVVSWKQFVHRNTLFWMRAKRYELAICLNIICFRPQWTLKIQTHKHTLWKTITRVYIRRCNSF